MQVKFVPSDQNRLIQFNQLVEKMSQQGQVRPEIIRTFLEFAFQNLDLAEFSEFNHIYVGGQREKSEIMRQVLNNFEGNISSIIENKDNVRQVINIARTGLSGLFEVVP
jgi:hypothetical protein